MVEVHWKNQAKAYNFIVTDQNMPGIEGLELVKTLSTLLAYASTPILVLTTETSDEMKSAFKLAGATGWMSKLFSPERMTAAISKLL